MRNYSLEGQSGRRWMTILGLLFMAIPFIIILNFSVVSTSGFWFWRSTNVTTPLRPQYLSAALAALFYIALIVRYDFFNRSTVVDLVISIAQFVLNVFVIASVIEVALFNHAAGSWQSTLLITAVALSWIGMKSIAGYAWIVFVAMAAINLNTLSEQMGLLGVVYVLACSLSLLLQVGRVSELKYFMEDFRGIATHTAAAIGDDMNAAALDAADRTVQLKSFVRKQRKQALIKKQQALLDGQAQPADTEPEHAPLQQPERKKLSSADTHPQ